MQYVLVVFLIVATAGAIAQELGAATRNPVSPEVVQDPSSENPSSQRMTATSSGARSLPDAPSHSYKGASSVVPQGSLVVSKSVMVTPGTSAEARSAGQAAAETNANGMRQSSLIYYGTGPANDPMTSNRQP